MRKGWFDMPVVKVEAEVHIHLHGIDQGDRSTEILRKLADLGLSLLQLQKKVSTMATKADFDALVASINAATNTIAARIQALEDKIATGGLTAEEEEAVRTELASVKTALESLGADPSNPVPEELR